MSDTPTRGQRVAAALGADRSEALAGGQPSLNPAGLFALASSATPQPVRPEDTAAELVARLRESLTDEGVVEWLLARRQEFEEWEAGSDGYL